MQPEAYCSQHERGAGGGHGCVCARFADVHLESVLAEADESGSGDDSPCAASGCGHGEGAEQRADTRRSGPDECHDEVLQALRRYRAAAWW